MTQPPVSTTGPESIVVSLDRARALKEAGWPQESVFVWFKMEDHYELHRNRGNMLMGDLAAPTAEELLADFKRRTGQDWGMILRSLSVYMLNVDSMADAAAAMWHFAKMHDQFIHD